MKLFLIDGHALVFKMYYAFLGRPMVNSKGVDTSILFGFTKYLLDLVAREKPDCLAVAFDPPGGTFRNELYPQYKANRGETPQLVIDALEPLCDIVHSLGIPILMIKGYEADDVIGSAAIKYASEGYDVYMVTPDKDYGQLVREHIWQYRPGVSGSDFELMGEAEVCAKWGISSTAQVVDMLAICGDSADNVPGVAGVGPVGAAKLLSKYGTLEGIYEHLDELTASQKAKFEAAKDHIWLSRTLVVIKTDIPIDIPLEELVVRIDANPQIFSLLDQYEMNSLRRRLGAEASISAFTSVAGTPVAGTPATDSMVEAKPLEGDMALSLAGGILFLKKAGEQMISGNPESLITYLEDASLPKVGAGLKAVAVRLAREWGIEMRGKRIDVSLMHYLLDPEKPHDLASLVGSKETDKPATELSLFDTEEDGNVSVESDLDSILELASALSARLDAEPLLRKLYDDIEEPLSVVLERMETVGVKIDVGPLKEFADGLRRRMLEREKEVRDIAQDPALNVSSPKQIGELIFEKLALDPKAKKSKTGAWSTDEQTLTELADRSPVIDAILDYRGLRKLLSTYIEPIPGYISALDGRVHTTFNQTLTSTGRLSSSNPNLQNIPIRTEDGREIRKAFSAPPGSVMMSADYSQIELRIMAHLCGDEHLQQAFRDGVDVHSATAAKIFGKPVDEVSAQERRMAKTANFGIMYGISSFGLAQRLKCSRSEAKQLIDDYFASFPSIRGFIDSTLEKARADLYVETVFGRRRYVPDLASRNGNLRAFAERNAVNAPIQGTAADIIKMAMIEVDRRLTEEGLKARMVLQIHDELVLEVPENEIDKVRELLVSSMEGVAKLSVPLTVECNYGNTWLEAH